MPPKKEDDRDRAFAIELAKYGALTCAEIANELGMSRQLVDYWLKQAKVDARACRALWIKRYLKNMKEIMR